MCSPLRVGISIVRWLVVLLFAVTVEAAAPTIAITGAAVEPNGAFIDIYMPFTVNTNGTFAFGYGSNNVPSTSTPYYKVVCPGYDDTAATNTISWAGFLTYPIRMAYPNATTNNIVVSGSSIIIPVAMSEFVYSNDVSGTLTFPVDGWYAQGGTNTAAGTVAITNNSTIAYPKVIANWSYPGTRQRIYGPTWTNRVVAFHQSGINGRPVRVVKFYGQQGANLVTPVLVTKPEIDHSMPDASPVIEYVCRTLSTNGLANLSVATNNFAAYPWRGDPNSVLDTGDGVRTLDTSPLYSPQKWYTTYANSYGTLVCVVSTSGDGVQHGGLTNYSLFTPDVTVLVPFDTIDHALVDLKASNNTYYSHNDCGGGIIYLTNSLTHVWLGGASAGYNTTPPTYCTITAYPGRTPSQVNIATQSGNKVASGTELVRGIGFSVSAGVSMITGETYIWFDQMNFNITGGTAWAFQNNIWWVTDSSVTAIQSNQGLCGYSTGNFPLSISRGNFIDGVTNTGNGLCSYTFIGNKKTALPAYAGASAGFQPFITGYGGPNFDNVICAYNQFYGQRANISTISVTPNQTNTGIAFIQNVIECCTNGSISAIVGMCNDGASTATGCQTNFLYWYNTIVGYRGNHCYNSVSGSNPNRKLWSMRRNHFDCAPMKSDNFSGAPAASSTNNWEQFWGVGNYGNVDANIVGTSFTGSFCHEFFGVNSFQNRQAAESNSDLPVTANNSTNSFPFINPQRYDGVNFPTGSGDYNLKSTAFQLQVNSANAANMQAWWGLPFDANGVPRGGFDPAGAFVGGQPRRTGMMFAN